MRAAPSRRLWHPLFDIATARLYIKNLTVMDSGSSEKSGDLLYISYFFPPQGGGGVYRVLKFVRYLPEFGWKPTVLTVREVWSRYLDPSLLEEIPAGADVVRTESLEPRRILFLLQKALGRRNARPGLAAEGPALKEDVVYKERPLPVRVLQRILDALRAWLLIPDEYIGWAPFAWLRGRGLIKRKKIKVVLTSGVPHSVHLVGWLLKKTTGVRWVAEFRDAWGYHPNYYFASSLHRALGKRLERFVYENADRVVLAYGLEENRKRYPELKDKFISVTNGYDESDFENLAAAREEGFNLVHVGTFYSNHTPEYFFRALAETLKEQPSLRDVFKVRLFGHLSEEHLLQVRELSLEPVVRVREFVPHLECLSYVVGADVLLLFLGGDEDSVVIPGKVFEYLRAPAPVLAMVPEGETAQIIRQGRAGIVAAAKDVDGIKKALLELYEDFKMKKRIEKDTEFVRTKERRELTRTMAEVLNEAALQAR